MKGKVYEITFISETRELWFLIILASYFYFQSGLGSHDLFCSCVVLFPQPLCADLAQGISQLRVTMTRQFCTESTLVRQVHSSFSVPFHYH